LAVGSQPWGRVASFPLPPKELLSVQRSSRAFATAAVVAGLGGLAAVALGAQPARRGATTVRALPPLVVTRTVTDVHTVTRVRRDLPPLTNGQGGG
jgi:hypothetical protein